MQTIKQYYSLLFWLSGDKEDWGRESGDSHELVWWGPLESSRGKLSWLTLADSQGGLAMGSRENLYSHGGHSILCI